MIAAGKKCGRGVEPRPHDSVSASPDELRAYLPDARIARIRDIAEVRAADVPARVRELRVIEYVEELTPKLQGHCFRNGDSLRYSEVRVVEARAVEEPAICRSETSAIRTD